MTTKMRAENWSNIPRNTKLAYVLYPAQAPKWAQDEMRRLSGIEGKQPPKGLPDAPVRNKVPSKR